MKALTKEKLETLLKPLTGKELAKRLAVRKWRPTGRPVKFNACRLIDGHRMK